MGKQQRIYAVRKGRTTGILMSWADCLKSVDRFPDAQYKSFPREQIVAANDYLNNRKREQAPNLLLGGIKDYPNGRITDIKVTSQWLDITICPPAPFQWVNVAYENADGELQLCPQAMYRKPDGRYWVVGIGAVIDVETVATFRYYCAIPELPVK